MAEITVSLAESISAIPAAHWDACACPETADGGRAIDPFTTHAFLSALETSGSVGPDTGWTPRPLVVSQDDQVIAVAPLYIKTHSQGEYVFDHAWAEAYERAGGRYYPKLQCAVPFSPVGGRRLLCLPEHASEGRAALLSALEQVAAQAGFSSAHVTFCTEDDAAAATGRGWLDRLGEQFHWENRNYRDFDSFLNQLASRKRKALRKERERAQAFGGKIRALSGDDIKPAHWDAMWDFYQDTGGRKWGTPYLTREFFEALHGMRGDVLLVLAERDGDPVAGALNLIGRDTLFGRYWGCLEDHAYLHFELCYHQAVDWAITHGFARVEAGAQGEHKLARGYMPVVTRSAHWIADPGFRRAVADYLDEERRAITEDVAALADLGPFRKAP